MIWKRVLLPDECFGFGNSWFFKMTNGWQSDKFLVFSRTLDIGVEHIAICRKDGAVVTWAEKQMIKNDLFGKERQAVELYPKESELINDSNVYHLWLIPRDKEFAFGKYLK